MQKLLYKNRNKIMQKLLEGYFRKNEGSVCKRKRCLFILNQPVYEKTAFLQFCSLYLSCR